MGGSARTSSVRPAWASTSSWMPPSCVLEEKITRMLARVTGVAHLPAKTQLLVAMYSLVSQLSVLAVAIRMYQEYTLMYKLSCHLSMLLSMVVMILIHLIGNFLTWCTYRELSICAILN